MSQEIDTLELPDDDFDLAFTSAVDESGGDAGLQEDPVQDETTDPPDKPEDKPEADEQSEEKPEDKPEEKPEEKPKEKPVIDEAEIRKQAEADARAKVEAENKAKQDEAARQQAAQEELKKKTDEAVAKEKPTEEEEKLFSENAEFLPDLPKILDANKRMILASVENMLEAKLEGITSAIEQKLAPVLEHTQTTARNSHEQAILSVHKDALTIIKDVEKWVDTKSPVIKKAYNDVLDYGTAEEINDLLTEYKTSAGMTQETPNAEEKAAEDAKKRQEKKERQERLDAQEGVRSRNSGGRSSATPDDFDGAFDKFAATA